MTFKSYTKSVAVKKKSKVYARRIPFLSCVQVKSLYTDHILERQNQFNTKRIQKTFQMKPRVVLVRFLVKKCAEDSLQYNGRFAGVSS